MSLPEPLLDDLAALRDGGRYRDRRDERPFRCRLDYGLTIEVPGPRILARVLVLPSMRQRSEVFQQGPSLLIRPHGDDSPPGPLDFAVVVADLRSKLVTLPERNDAGRPYRDLRLLAAEGSPALAQEYLLGAVRSARMLAPVWKPRKESRPRPPARTPAQRRADTRERHRAQEEASAEWWLRGFFEHADEEEFEPPAPGAWIEAGDLYARASPALTEYAEDEEDEEELDPWDGGTPFQARAPGRSRFYAVADRLLGPRRRTAKARGYIVPASLGSATVEPLFEPVVERAAEILAAEFHAEAVAARVGDHSTAESLAATG